MIDLSNLYHTRPPQTKFHYTSDYYDVPIVIDNGSYQFRAGFATEPEPFLKFKNVIAKPKSKKDGILVGDYIEDYSSQVRYSFDRNVVVNFEVQENVFDYAFDNLGVQSLREHPIVINEPLCNPNICRQQMSELLFEAYNVPSLTYYIDGLASYAYNNPEYLESVANDTALIVSFGYQTIHLLPIFGGKLEAKLCRKINVGGSQLDSLMTRLLQLKYACHANIIDLRMGETLQQKFCRVAIDYRAEMLRWKSHDYFAKNSIKIQIPYKRSDKMSQDQLEERKRQQSFRGKEISNKRNQEKLVSAQENLASLMDVLNCKENSQKTLKLMGYESQDQLMLEIKRLEENIVKLQNKINGLDRKDKSEVSDDKDKYDLIDVSDDELDEEEIRLKQKQIMMKAAAVRREQIRLMKELQRNKILNAVSKLEETRDEDFPLWIMNLRHRRQYLIDNRLKRRTATTTSTSASGGGGGNVDPGNSAISNNGISNAAGSISGALHPHVGPSVGLDERRQQKVRKIRRLAAELQHDDDEDVYDNNNKNRKSTKQQDNLMNRYEELSDDESDTEQKQLTQLEILLSQYDPEFTKDNTVNLKIDLGEYYRLQLTTEQLRVPETIFHPYLIGLEDAGLAEVMENLILGSYLVHLNNNNNNDGSTRLTKHDTLQLANNIFITGSLCRLPNISDRLFREVRSILPTTQSDPVITMAENPSLDGWRGACKLACHTQFESMGGITKEAYDEMGHDYIMEHPLSNYYYTPLTDVDNMDQ